MKGASFSEFLFVLQEDNIIEFYAVVSVKFQVRMVY